MNRDGWRVTKDCRPDQRRPLCHVGPPVGAIFRFSTPPTPVLLLPATPTVVQPRPMSLGPEVRVCVHGPGVLGVIQPFRQGPQVWRRRRRKGGPSGPPLSFSPSLVVGVSGVVLD